MLQGIDFLKVPETLVLGTRFRFFNNTHWNFRGGGKLRSEMKIKRFYKIIFVVLLLFRCRYIFDNRKISGADLAPYRPTDRKRPASTSV